VLTKNTLTIHNCSIKDASNHMALVINESDMSVRFLGNFNMDG
jgi:hypothetical protein